MVFCGIENLGKQSLQHLSSQHNLDVSLEGDLDSTRTVIVDHIASGGHQTSISSLCTSVNDEYHETASGTKGDLETHVLQLAAKKGKLSKKALQRVLGLGLSGRNFYFSNFDF
jgi:hypothetical protein